MDGPAPAVAAARWALAAASLPRATAGGNKHGQAHHWAAGVELLRRAHCEQAGIGIVMTRPMPYCQNRLVSSSVARGWRRQLLSGRCARCAHARVWSAWCVWRQGCAGQAGASLSRRVWKLYHVRQTVVLRMTLPATGKLS